MDLNIKTILFSIILAIEVSEIWWHVSESYKVKSNKTECGTLSSEAKHICTQY